MPCIGCRFKDSLDSFLWPLAGHELQKTSNSSNLDWLEEYEEIDRDKELLLFTKFYIESSTGPQV